MKKKDLRGMGGESITQMTLYLLSLKSLRRARSRHSRAIFHAAVLFTLLLADLSWSQVPHSQNNSHSTREKTFAVQRLNNLGVAYMDRQEFKRALSAFDSAHAIDSSDLVPQLNRGIALLNLQKDEAALPILQALAAGPGSHDARVWYNLGLLHRASGRLAPAMDAFQKVTELKPNDPDALYFLADLYQQQQQYDQAIAAYQTALSANPFHISSEFGLAQAYRRKGDAAQAREHFERFQQLSQKKLGLPVSRIYGEQGKLSLAQQITLESEVGPAIPVQFTLATSHTGLPTAQRAESHKPDKQPQSAGFVGSGVCIFDFDDDGLPDIFLGNNRGTGPGLFKNLGHGQYRNVTASAGLSFPDAAIGCAAGDYDNDGHPDLALTFPDRVLLLHNDGKKFRDVSATAKIHVSGDPVGITFVDYDHDGYLDLYVTRFTPFDLRDGDLALTGKPEGNILWRNNGDGTFTDVTQATGLSGNSPSLSAIASDLNNDRAIDLVHTSWNGSPSMYLNPREGTFQASRPWKNGDAASAVGVSVLDFDKDGWMDVAFTQSAAPGISLWRNVDGHHFEAVALPKVDWKRAWGIAAFDYDNDGWIDIAAVGEPAHGAEIRLFRNRGKQGFEDVTSKVGLDKVQLHDPRALVAFDSDNKKALDLLVTELDGSVVLLRNVGGNRNNSTRIALKGLADNKTALGTKVEIYAGAQHQKWEIAGSSGYLSQAPAEVTAGLGKEKKVDVVRVIWPTGVVQDEINLAAEQKQDINEIDRRGSSCPVLFAWNGKSFQLITDVIGPAVIGHWIAPGQRNTPDPDEYIKIDASQLRPHDGLLSLRFAEPMEEVNYIDQVRLLAIDHPAGKAVFPNERFASDPPFPEFKVITSSAAFHPKGAWDSTGKNVLPELLERDHKFVAGFQRLKFAGFAEMHTLELDLGAWDSSRPLRLLMHGFTEYFSANSMYAAYKAGVKVVAPYLEAQDANGKWIRVVDDLGFPAGLPRTMVADLTGHLPSGTRRIRIVTNLQVYWDQILIDQTPEDTSVRQHEVPLAHAALHFHGYPRSVEEHFRGELDYLYDEVSLTGPYARHIGSYTHYGDVLPLLQRVDDHFAIFGSGEELMLDFDPAKLPPLPSGWKRDYFFYANGFVKDMDFYEADALTVGPLPFHAMQDYPYSKQQHYLTDDPSTDYQLDYNTRFQSGNGIASYRFNFPN
jgi:tetratricopeptide (TPR) repeat protein